MTVAAEVLFAGTLALFPKRFAVGIRDVILTGFPIPAKYGRIGTAKVYKFGQNRLDRYYEQKRVEVFYFIKGNLITTVTVYVFYGKWEV